MSLSFASGLRRNHFLLAALLLVLVVAAGAVAWVRATRLPDHVAAYAELPYPCGGLRFIGGTHLVAATCGNTLPGTNQVVALDARSGATQFHADTGPSLPLGLTAMPGSRRLLLVMPTFVSVLDERSGRRLSGTALPFTAMAFAADEADGQVVIAGGAGATRRPMAATVDATTGAVTHVAPLPGSASGGAGPVTLDAGLHRLFISVGSGVDTLAAPDLCHACRAR